MLFLLAFDFCRFCVVIRFFIPATTANDLQLQKDFLSQILSITFFIPILILQKEPVFPFNVECQTRELLVSFLLRLWYDAVNVFTASSIA